MSPTACDVRRPVRLRSRSGPSRTDRVDAVETRVERLPDLSDRIRKAGAAPLEERAAILAAIHETLSSELRDAED